MPLLTVRNVTQACRSASPHKVGDSGRQVGAAVPEPVVSAPGHNGDRNEGSWIASGDPPDRQYQVVQMV
ncbi:hypothetical protein BN2537_499 [Streptomyces venezuelae]|nr:hypothetical protein BN2537_499 [Streptomyces venezuelae]